MCAALAKRRRGSSYICRPDEHCPQTRLHQILSTGNWLNAANAAGMARMLANTGGKQGGRFSKGQSGNPRGKPKGARHRSTLAAEALLDGEAEALTRKAIEMALAGESTALRLCLNRILSPRRERP